MGPGFKRHASALIACAASAALAGCASDKAAEQAAQVEAARVAAEIQAARAAQPMPLALNQSVLESAAIYVAFTRDIATLQGGFASPEEIQAAMRRGAAYDSDQISRGLVAYAAVLALQSPEFLAGVRQFGTDLQTRNQAVARIVANPAYASTLPGADAAAGLIIGVMEADITRLRQAADSIENDAYAIQTDGRQAWARLAAPDREARIQEAKDLSARRMLADAGEAARLTQAAYSGSGLGVSTPRLRTAPYPPAVTNALAIAALAALNGAGENARANTDALLYDRAGQDCFASSKLNLFQCLAAARPSYEVEFCLGRHVVRDLSTCARGAALPAAIITVDNPVQTRTDIAPAIRTQPLGPPLTPGPSPLPTSSLAPTDTPTPVVTPAPAPVQAPTLTPTQRLNASPTQRLNTTPVGPNR